MEEVVEERIQEQPINKTKISLKCLLKKTKRKHGKRIIYLLLEEIVFALTHQPVILSKVHCC